MEAVTELESQALSIPDQARALTIRTAEDYSLAGELLLKIKTLRGKIEEVFGPIIEKAHQAHKEAIAQRKNVEAPLVIAELHLKPLMARYVQDQESKRKEAEAAAQAEARRKTEEEQLARAEAAEKSGDHESAEQIISQPIQETPVVLPSETPRVVGVSYREQWKFRVVDEAKIPREYLTPDLTKIGGVVRALKGVANIPGIETYSEQIVAAGRAF